MAGVFSKDKVRKVVKFSTLPGEKLTSHTSSFFKYQKMLHQVFQRTNQDCKVQIKCRLSARCSHSGQPDTATNERVIEVDGLVTEYRRITIEVVIFQIDISTGSVFGIITKKIK